MDNIPIFVVGALFFLVNYFALRHIIKTANENTTSLLMLLEEALRSAREDTSHALEVAKAVAELIPGRADDALVEKLIEMHKQLFNIILGEEPAAAERNENAAV